VALLSDSELDVVAVLRIEGYTGEEIPDRLGFAPRWVKRRLSIIRAGWEKEVTA
jgi:hypothetical protein